MKNKSTYILIALLLFMVVLIVFISNSISEKKRFVKPEFEKDAVYGVPDMDDFEKKVIKIKDGYEIYINPIPIIKQGRLLVDLTSVKSNNILLKLRIKDSNDNIIGESGILNPGQYLEYLEIDGINNNEEITYIVMGYEVDSYLSAGTVSLKTKVGEVNEKDN